MSTKWTLRRVSLRDFAGFRGEQSFDFRNGVQVVHAPNHTGKTTLAMGILWGVAGVVPELPRLDRTSFRLTNRHAGRDATPRVTVELVAGDGRTLVIRRPYANGRRARSIVEVEIDGRTHHGDAAEAVIAAALGVRSASLEGTGIVLQDHRLRIVTRTADLNEVISDVLGLTTVARLVPALNDRKNEANRIARETATFLAGSDPVKRWLEKNEELEARYWALREKGVAAGFAEEALDDAAGLLRAEIEGHAAEIGAQAPDAKLPPARALRALTEALSELRARSEVVTRLAALEERASTLEARTTEIVARIHAWKALDRKIADGGVLDRSSLEARRDAGALRLEENRRRRKEIHDQQGVVSAALGYLKAHDHAKDCPVCGGGIRRDALMAKLGETLGRKLRDELESLESSDREAEEARKGAEAGLEQLERLRSDVQDELARTTDRLEACCALGIGSAVPAALPANDDLVASAAAREKRIGSLSAVAAALRDAVAAARVEQETAREARRKEEERRFRPIEQRIARLRDDLCPVVDAASELELHGRRRDAARDRKEGLEELAAAAASLRDGLAAIRGALSEVEQARADEAIRSCREFSSRFFARVAENPDYTGLEIQTTVARDRLRYALRATSLSSPDLEDAAGHVLSEGDLSAAAMAFLVGLARSSSGGVGFLVIDDPAQGMDSTLRGNLARELAAIGETQQIVVLTHQRDFAKALENAGASRMDLGRWKGGRLEPGAEPSE